MSADASRVRLGRTELKVSPICFGTWQLSPRFWGPLDEQQVINALRRGFELGVNFIDTADAYGEGYAEEVVGRAMGDLPREQVVLATKVFWHFREDGHRYPNLSREHILSACEASLRRLRLDYIDLYQCHAFDPLTPVDEIIDALDHLKRQGKIRHYGTSNWTVEQMRAGERGDFATSQPFYSLIGRSSEDDLLPYCLRHDVGVLVYSPLHNGLLSGKYRGDETFSDFRAQRADFTGERFRMLSQRVARAGEIGHRYGLTTVQLVLASTLMHPAITCAIVGIKNPRQIEEAAAAMGKAISREDWYAVRGLLKG
jgi:aryl-alcohol dehydrogenase-like predicted oxidoreductase